MSYSITSSSSCVPFHVYTSLNASASEVFSGRGNLYGFIVENNSAADIYVQFFDKALGDVTVGVTVPTFTARVPASSAFGRDPVEIPYKFFALGCIVAVTSTRTGAGAPGADATAQFWFVNRQP